MSEETTTEIHTNTIEFVSAKVFKSVTIGKLAAALAKAQTEFSKVLKDTKNPYYGSKYADLAGVIEATQPALAKNGLVVMQFSAANIDNKTQTLTTILAHSSDEWISSELTVPATMLGKDKVIKFDVQSIGSAMTYCRRYSYQAIVGVSAEDDDDGNTLRGNAVEQADEYDQRTELQRLLMPAQAQACHEAMKRTGKPAEMVTKFLEENYKVNQFEKLMRSDFQTVLKWLNSYQKREGENAPQANSSQQTEKQVREAVNKKVWALAAEKSVPEADVKQFAYEKFSVDSMTKLTAANLREVADWINTLG